MVRINTSLSRTCSVTSGVPQGSCLGPLLFNIFINDITDHLYPNIHAKLFADDLKLYTDFSLLSPNNLQLQLDQIHLWSTTWQMTISHKKCNILAAGHNPDTTQYLINNNPISNTESTKDLGVTVDLNLNFHAHINNIVQQARQRSAQIFRCFLSRNPTILIRAYKTYVRPILEYASTTWSPSSIHFINLLESVQRSFTKRIPGCSHLSYLERLTLLKLQTLEHRRLITDLIMCFNILKSNICIDQSTFFTFPTYKSSRGHSLKLSIPLAKLNIRKCFFACRIPSAWNSLSDTAVQSHSTSTFKYHATISNLSKFLIFPSINPYV
jgi:hypothetical protein